MANKIQKCATNRFWLKFGFLTVITLGIYALVFYVRWGKDLNRVKEKANIEGKPLMNAFGALLLGIITIGIVPLTWSIKLVLRTYHAAKVLGTEKKGSTALVIIFNSLLVWTVICPIIAFHCLCKTMNNLGKWYNAEIEKLPEPTPAAIEENPTPEVLPEPKVEKPAPVVEEKETPVEKPAPAKKPAPVKEKKPTEKPVPAEKPVSKETKPTKKETTKDEKPAPAVKPEKTGGVGANGAKIYHISKRKDDGKWQVKFANGSKAIKLFDTQAEAIEFAKTLAKNQEGSIRIHSVKGKIRK